LSPKTAGGAANRTIVMAKNIAKKKTTDIKYADNKHGASLFLRLALIEPNNPPSASNKNTIDII
jgi:hypothetical protein